MNNFIILIMTVKKFFQFDFLSDETKIRNHYIKKEIFKISIILFPGLMGIFVPLFFIIAWKQITTYFPIIMMFGLILFIVGVMLIIDNFKLGYSVSKIKMGFAHEYLEINIDGEIKKLSYNNLEYKRAIISFKETINFI